MRAGTALTFYTAMCVMLVFAKGCGALDWEWVAVLAPIWVPVLVALSVAFLILVLGSILGVIGGR